MKKYAFLTLSLVLTAVLLVGCGCTNRNVEDTSAPTVLPTNEEVWDTTEATTRATTETTVPSTMDIIPGDTNETTDRGNGPLEDNGTNHTTSSTESTESTGAAEGRTRSAMPGTR